MPAVTVATTLPAGADRVQALLPAGRARLRTAVTPIDPWACRLAQEAVGVPAPLRPLARLVLLVRQERLRRALGPPRA